MPERKLALPCECIGTCGVAIVTVLEPWGDDPMETFIGFHQRVGYESVRQRARAAWRVLRGRDPWVHDVTLSVAQMDELGHFLLSAAFPRFEASGAVSPPANSPQTQPEEEER